MIHRYAAYGLDIDSEFPLPELGVRRGGAPDVRVVLGSVTPSGLVRDVWSCPEPQRARLDYDGVARLEVSRGEQILVDAHAVDPHIARLPVLGGGLAHLLRQRCQLVLHANVVAVAGVAVAFVGQRGWGKSTACAALVAAGHPLVCDDVAPIDDAGRVSPGFGMLKLWPDTAQAVGHSVDALALIHPEVTKRWVPAPLAAGPLPLAAVYVLTGGERTRVVALQGAALAVQLVAHTYGAESLHPDLRGPHLERVAELGRRVHGRRLEVPRGLDRLAELVEAVERDVRGWRDA